MNRIKFFFSKKWHTTKENMDTEEDMDIEEKECLTLTLHIAEDTENIKKLNKNNFF